MNDYFYSKKNNGFYPLSLKEDYEASPNGWPDDAVSISEEDYNALNAGQASGKIISTDDNGYPVLVDPPPLSQEQLAINATEERESLLAEATIKIAPLQDAVDIEVATDEEKSQLTAWKKYRVMLNRVDISKAPDITWPEKPD